MQEQEVVGVDMYGVQQQLAKLQEDLEKAHDNFITISGIREETETRKNVIFENAGQRRRELDGKKKKCKWCLIYIIDCSY